MKLNLKLSFSSLAFLFSINMSLAQSDADVIFVNELHKLALKEGKSYDWLKELCSKAGPRIAGSKEYEKAVEISLAQLKSITNVKTSIQDVQVDYWKRGSSEIVKLFSSNGEVIPLVSLSLGNSISTDSFGITGEVIEVQNFTELEKLGDKVKNKIVFFNRPMDPGSITTFSAYGGAVDQRVFGASKAAALGAIGVVVRSMTTEIDDFAHTGVMQYDPKYNKIPALAISTQSAELLSSEIKNKGAFLYFKNHSEMIGKMNSPNVIGEILGSENPEKVILVGGHLDAWDVAQGAHDDGSGCVQSMDVLYLLQKMGYKPKNTIRCVLFSSEENGLHGGKAYAERAIKDKESHIFSLESDSGGFTPRGFTFDADTSVLKKYFKNVNDHFLPILEGLGYKVSIGGSGADIGPLKPLKGLLAGLKPDSQRYFDFHHTKRDTIDAVHPRELKLGAAAMASLVYLIDKFGIE
jgi:carboxypeptidase Q